ncbi:MAG: type II CAAX endopeptidase family protein [Cyanobacteriota bacterium]|nr:type II CAAX endopeptidase family protein [Cyanobacteriota bacterium]
MGSWKGLLALVALCLSGLIWISGLQDSLSRPSVVSALELRQLELTVLTAEVLPPSFRPLLVGEDPRDSLVKVLEQQSKDPSIPPSASRRLELTLLQRSQGNPPSTTKASALDDLATQVDPSRRPLLVALQGATSVSPAQQQVLLAPWGKGSLIAQLGCEQLGGPASTCPAQRQAPWLIGRFLALTVLPALLMVAGVVLLGRQLWLLQRGRLASPPPLVAPPLSLVDVTLVIAGGFVLLGEVLLPALTQGGLHRLLSHWTLPGDTRQGIDVLGSYLTLALAPLGILALFLARHPNPPRGGWLQWGWRPFSAVVVPALHGFLMVIPLVALATWMLQQVWTDPGGSNPLLEMVLASSNGLALLAFALTAVVFAPLFEETLFRGVLLPVLSRHMGGLAAVGISALLFALAHLSLGELVPLSVLGMGLGLLRWRSGRLGAAVCLHALWNGLTFLNLLLLAR